MDARRTVAICWLLLLPLGWGCARWQKQPVSGAPLLLKPAEASPQSVTLEIFFARTEWADPQINERLWQRVDEQQLSTDLRRKLASNGLRAGIIGGQVPTELATLLHLTDQAQPEVDLNQGVKLDAEPAVRRRLLQLSDGRRGEILASPLIDSLPLLLSEEGTLHGHTFKKAQGLFTVTATPIADRRVQLHLTPEVHHGEAKQQWTGQDGMLHLEMARPKELFAALEISAPLAPGQMLLITCLPDRPGSLGQHFFSDQTPSRGKEQKLLIIRLVQTPPSELYLPELPLVAESDAP